ncbi:MAG: hypothetical protein U1E52_11865 [Geminicoccaceae bacterium]
MLLEPGTGPQQQSEIGLRWWSDDAFVIGWKGHVYLPGEVAGAATVERLARLLKSADLAEIAGRLRGVFGLFVWRKATRSWQVTVDNAGFYKVYFDSRGAGTGFLELVRDRRLDRAGVSEHALVEFLAYGAVSRGKTLARDILELSGREVLSLDGGKGVSRIAKSLDLPGNPDAEHAVTEHFAMLAHSLRGRRLSVDATGGFDSRLVMCMLSRQQLEFELAISGQSGTPDVDIAHQIARLLDRPFHLVSHDLDRFDEQLAATFRAGDAQTDVRRLHRDRQAALARLGRGVEIFAHGGGGEFFRDHYVIQDFPFYGSSRVNVQRYHDLRMLPVSFPPETLSAQGRELLRAQTASVLEFCREMHSPTNNETYDKIFLHVRAPEFYGHYFSNYINMGLDVTAPLADYHNIQAAIMIPPWRRFFFRWHRHMITANCPALAALPTADGFTASSEPRLMAGDVRAYGATQLRRAARKLSQRLTGKGKFYTAGAFAADADGFMAKLRGSTHLPPALERLKTVGVLAPDVAAESLRDLHVGRALTLGMFLGEVGGLA